MQARQHTAAWSGVEHQTAPCWQAGIRWGGSAAIAFCVCGSSVALLPCYMHGSPLGQHGGHRAGAAWWRTSAARAATAASACCILSPLASGVIAVWLLAHSSSAAASAGGGSTSEQAMQQHGVRLRQYTEQCWLVKAGCRCHSGCACSARPCAAATCWASQPTSAPATPLCAALHRALYRPLTLAVLLGVLLEGGDEGVKHQVALALGQPTQHLLKDAHHAQRGHLQAGHSRHSRGSRAGSSRVSTRVGRAWMLG